MLRNLKLRLVHIVSAWLVKDLLRAVHEDELLVQTSQGWYIGTRRLAPEEISALRAEADQFRKSYLWRFISKDIKYIAFLRATNKARSDEDLIYSSAMYYNLEIIEKFIANCKKF